MNPATKSVRQTIELDKGEARNLAKHFHEQIGFAIMEPAEWLRGARLAHALADLCEQIDKASQ